ncbi:beta-2-microglobulin-like isoform 1-T1 [Polymixia lowei]
MKAVIGGILFCVIGTIMAKDSLPKVEVYSRTPGFPGKPNTLICHVSQFYPPVISIELLKNGVEIPGSKQTDLAFEQNWQFHLTKNVAFTPASSDTFTCRVTHLGKSNSHTWVSDM